MVPYTHHAFLTWFNITTRLVHVVVVPQDSEEIPPFSYFRPTSTVMETMCVGNRCGPRHRRLWQADWCRRITHQDLSRLRLIAAFNRNSCGLTEGLLSGSTLPRCLSEFSFSFVFLFPFFFSFHRVPSQTDRWWWEKSWFNERLSRITRGELREKLAGASFKNDASCLAALRALF